MDLGGSIDSVVDADILKRDILLDNLKVYDNATPFDVALGPVSFYDKIDYSNNSTIYSYMLMYESEGIKDMFGIDIIDFLSLSVEEIDIMLNASKTIAEKRNKAMDELNIINKGES